MNSTYADEESKGAVLFTGPDGARNQRITVEERKFIGHGSSSPEASGDTRYILRGAATIPHPLPKHSKVGEIGWGVPTLDDHSLLRSGNQITLGTFRQQAEDRHTHLYQEPYYPSPRRQDDKGTKKINGIEKTHNGEASIQIQENESHQLHPVT